MDFVGLASSHPFEMGSTLLGGSVGGAVVSRTFKFWRNVFSFAADCFMILLFMRKHPKVSGGLVFAVFCVLLALLLSGCSSVDRRISERGEVLVTKDSVLVSAGADCAGRLSKLSVARSGFLNCANDKAFIFLDLTNPNCNEERLIFVEAKSNYDLCFKESKDGHLMLNPFSSARKYH